MLSEDHLVANETLWMDTILDDYTTTIYPSIILEDHSLLSTFPVILEDHPC